MTDPYRLLGVAPGAGDDAIRAAYLAAIRDCPPERDRERFERVRAAFETIAHEGDRLAFDLFDNSVPTALDMLERLRSDWQPGRPDERNLRRLLGAP